MIRSIALLSAIVMVATTAAAQVNVRGHYRSNGTYVAPYTRSSPNSTTADNYGSAPRNNYAAPAFTPPRPLYGTPAPAPAPAPSCSGYGCYGQPSTVNGMPRTTTVAPYVRRDGTYVQPHVRSRPGY